MTTVRLNDRTCRSFQLATSHPARRLAGHLPLTTDSRSVMEFARKRVLHGTVLATASPSAPNNNYATFAFAVRNEY